MADTILSVRAIVDVLEQQGVPREAFFGAARFDSARLDDSNGRIELEELDALIDVALKLTGNEALGLQLGEMMSTLTFNVVAHLVAHAPTLREGIEALIRFHLLVTDRPMWRILEGDGKASLVCELLPGPLRCRRFRAEVTTVGFHRLLKQFDRLAKPRSIAFDYPAPPYRAEYSRLFEGAERFEESFIGIVFDQASLDAKQPHDDAELHATLREEAQRRVSRLTRTATYADQVRAYLLACAPPERRMDAVARALGMSPRSLRRRLTEEGSSYDRVVEEALATVAKRLISDEDCPTKAAAHRMGYSDTTAFQRAFKRWTGFTPKEYRSRRHGGDSRKV
jgi:AraC-like DNA-binding protein